jgi:hypothetical protein
LVKKNHLACALTVRRLVRFLLKLTKDKNKLNAKRALMIQRSRLSTLFALSFLVFVAVPAWAVPVPVTVPVTVGGTDYNIAWQIGTFDDVNAAVGLTVQDWWGDDVLASDLASALGFRSDTDDQVHNGPYFAHAVQIECGYVSEYGGCFQYYNAVYAFTYVSGSFSSIDGTYETISGSFPFNLAYAYDAGISPVPAPPALILFAFGLAGLGLAKRRIGKAQGA